MLDAPASGRMAVAEALTNLAAADVARLEDIKLSANWMAACGVAGQDAALYDTVSAVSELCQATGLSIPVGKDSLSMKTSWEQDGEQRQVVAPVSLIITAFAPVADVRASLTPQLRTDAGDSVLIQGTGGVSIFALQFAKMAGATVIATSSSDAKLERLREMGADHLINYRSTPAWGETVRKMTDGRGVDHVIEVGGPATLEQSMVAARIGGHISVIGILTGVAGELPLVPALVRQLRLQGVLVGSRAQQQEMIRAIDANGIRPVIDKHFAVDDIVEAFRYQETNQHFGKICLDI